MIDTYKIVSRGRFLFFFIALVLLGAWVINKAYQKHFNQIQITPAEQESLGIDLLEFPRNMKPIERLKSQDWSSFYVEPENCDTLCVRTLAQLEKIELDAKAAKVTSNLEIQVINNQISGYKEYLSLIRSPGYSQHFDRILLINPKGQFAGSIIAPYNLAHWQALDKRLNQ